MVLTLMFPCLASHPISVKKNHQRKECKLCFNYCTEKEFIRKSTYLDPISITHKSHNYNQIYFSKVLQEWLCCGSILSLLQILFTFFQTHSHQITITKTKEIKFEPRIKLNHNSYTYNFVHCPKLVDKDLHLN